MDCPPTRSQVPLGRSCCKLAMNPTVSVILPIHNQAEQVSSIIGEYRAALLGFAVPWEIILVENGSRDESGARCAELQARYPDIRAVSVDAPGWGRAVRTGLAAARGEFLCYTNSARTAGE